MTIFKLIEEERKKFRKGNHRWVFRHSIFADQYGSGLNAEAYRLYNCLNTAERINAEDKGEIVRHWLEHDEYYDHYPKKPLKTVDNARESVMRIDDGRIGSDTWWPEESAHPVWHTRLPF